VRDQAVAQTGNADLVKVWFADNCCDVKGVMKEVFPKAKVRLDLYHLVYCRLLKHVGKYSLLYCQYIS
jgi:hypothetical protein